MNIFFLSKNIKNCAKYHCDKHVVKMILEMTQLLYTAHHCNKSDISSAPFGGYRKTHMNHPTAIWVREHINNYIFCVKLALALCEEYTYRYGKVHKCKQHLEWLMTNKPVLQPVTYSERTQRRKIVTSHNVTDIPLAITNSEYHLYCPIASYRAYYRGDKKEFAKWTKRDEPPWW